MNTIYAVADIHGHSDLLDALMDFIRRDSETREAPPVIYFLGDMVDRGPDSRGVITRIMKIMNEFKGSKAHLGNHDHWFLDALDGIYGPGRDSWTLNGGIETVDSYEMPIDDNSLPVIAREYPDHVEFLRRAPIYTRHGGMVFVHAGIDRTLPMKDQREGVMLWTRDSFLNMDSWDDGRLVFHGHTISPSIDVSPNRIGLDTGSYATGRLSCAIIDPVLNQISFASTQGFGLEAAYVEPILVGNSDQARRVLEDPMSFSADPLIESPSRFLHV